MKQNIAGIPLLGFVALGRFDFWIPAGLPARLFLPLLARQPDRPTPSFFFFFSLYEYVVDHYLTPGKNYLSLRHMSHFLSWTEKKTASQSEWEMDALARATSRLLDRQESHRTGSLVWL
jgi:hypothetical protein